MMRPSGWPTGRAERIVLLALGALLLVGVGLRIAVMLTRGPGFFGTADSFLYIRAARDELFSPPTWPVGYQAFLRGAHALSPTMSFAIALQHALGVGTALLLFATVRRVAPAAWGLLPAAVVLLSGPVIFLEQAVLSETLFTFLVAATCYCAVRALGAERPRWAFATGLVGAAAGCVRPIGLLPAALAIVWLAAGTPGALRRRLLAAGTAALAAWLLLAGYVAAARHEVGYVGPGLSRAGGWNLYARVAPFADCDRFTPPARARGLCEQRPPSERPAPSMYATGVSPATRVFEGWSAVRPADDRALTAFARGAVLHQPDDYLRTLAVDLSRFWSSDRYDERFPRSDYDAFLPDLSVTAPGNVAALGGWYATAHAVAQGAPGGLGAYVRHTRLEGPLFVLLLALGVVGVALARGRRLAVGILLLGSSAAVLVGPIATLYFSPRYAIPGYGLLAAAGAVGCATLWERTVPRLARRRRGLRIDGRVAA
jgi:4-amino-4-deoxy-L-arabinose transferase-like glycosyltransferase